MNASSSNESGTATVPEPLDIRHLTDRQLAALGVSEIAYIKPVVLNGVPAFAIHAADGTPMAVADDAEVAMAAIRQHEMLPARVH